ncbi:hypothetical protein Pelo_8441 [Pelomyxa schiedti]|nr:hypothetical protein Pelo_8441 [Pelomyxa schiedti]
MIRRYPDPVLYTTALFYIPGTLNSDAGGGPADNLSPRTMDATDKHSAWQALPAFTLFPLALIPLALAHLHSAHWAPTLHSAAFPTYTHSTCCLTGKLDLSGHLWKLFLTDLEFDTRNDQLAANIGHLLWTRWQAQESLPAAEMTACHQGCVGIQAPSIAHHRAFLYCDTGGGLFTSHPQNLLHACLGGTVVNPQGVCGAARPMAPVVTVQVSSF